LILTLISSRRTATSVCSSKRRKRKKTGTYKLPGAKKVYKKQPETMTVVKPKPKAKVKTSAVKSLDMDTIVTSTPTSSDKTLRSVSDATAKDDHSNTDDVADVSVKSEMSSQDSYVSIEPSGTDDSFLGVDKSFRNKKKTGKSGRKSKWQRGCLPAKKHAKKGKPGYAVTKVEVKEEEEVHNNEE